jgi:hypothetical protein
MIPLWEGVFKVGKKLYRFWGRLLPPYRVDAPEDGADFFEPTVRVVDVLVKAAKDKALKVR